MGNYSYLWDSSLKLTCSKKEFIGNLLAFMLGVNFYGNYDSVLKPEFNKHIEKLSKDFSQAEMDEIKSKAVTYNISEITKVHISYWVAVGFEDDDEPYINIDGWKIQGYWYSGFCAFLYHLWYCGLRGSLSLNEEQNQDFVIRFEDDDIYVDFYPLAGFNDDEDSDEEQPSSIEMGIEETLKLRDILGAKTFQEKTNLPYLK